MAIIGGGVAALEAMLALDAISYSGADVHLFSPKSRFVLKPLAVLSGFGRGGMLNFDLRKLTATAGASFHNLSVSEVDTNRRVLDLSDGTEFDYDYLIASPGTKSLYSVPGTTTYWGPAGNEAVAEALAPLRDREEVNVVVTMPAGGTWPLPIYELALLIGAEPGVCGSVTIVTPERSVLELFGEAASEKVSALLRYRNIETILGTAPAEYRDGALTTTDGRQIKADLAIALPLLTGRKISGLPYDEQGFIPVDEYGQIEQHSREFAAGDVTSNPVKFGGLATEQADVVASAIAAAAWKGPEPKPFRPVYRGTLATADGLIDLGPGSGSSEPYAWDPAEKVQGKYLTPFLKAADPAALGTD
ncbi:MAG: FAD-dependent oxidoreductase [Solirubrobacterales bacterium]